MQEKFRREWKKPEGNSLLWRSEHGSKEKKPFFMNLITGKQHEKLCTYLKNARHGNDREKC
ncbi:MAG: hypothetical protein AB3K77_13810 [Methanosarcinaceae archaeon]|uniref:hypothetical protein n=1 Tax=Methanosarcina sp. MTP4 TaxID=1434100 RepID=UPI0012E0508B|nr:hypothetical protein [Methanosarcina sp. MTP4]